MMGHFKKNIYLRESGPRRPNFEYGRGPSTLRMQKSLNFLAPPPPNAPFMYVVHREICHLTDRLLHTCVCNMWVAPTKGYMTIQTPGDDYTVCTKNDSSLLFVNYRVEN